MTQMIMLPETAPFSEAQRAWLNGFFSGLFGAIGSAAGTVAARSAVPAVAETAPAEDETFPWHDPSLPLDERMQLAEGRPVERQLMAAMAQLDCGSCGYECQSYAEAIADGSEKDLTKCAPGGAETAKKLKELVPLLVKGKAAAPSATAKTSPAPAVVKAEAPPAVERPPGGQFNRNYPFPGRLVTATPLNAAESDKDTRHVIVDLRGSNLTYSAGDALGVYPENDEEDVRQILTLLGATGAEDVPGRRSPFKMISLREALTCEYCIAKPTPAVLQLLAGLAKEPTEAAQLAAAAKGEAPELLDLRVGDLLQRFRSARPTPAALVGALSSLRPRLYSISSSPAACPDEVHLTVGVVRYRAADGTVCKGVASNYLAERVRPGMTVRVYVHQAPHFRLPNDPTTPVIMIGPGTGIAPFRAFLQERATTRAAGPNWLFFGDRSAATDFLYRDELAAWQKSGVLTRLDTAFSRDGQQKVYVQHRMLEQGGELWAWLGRGAHVYVCGDASRMAADVDAALRTIVQTHGGMDTLGVETFMKELVKAKRYQKDVY